MKIVSREAAGKDPSLCSLPGEAALGVEHLGSCLLHLQSLAKSASATMNEDSDILCHDGMLHSPTCR